MSNTRTINKFRNAIGVINGFESETQIADFLLVNGYKGRKGKADSCPIANYVKSACKADSVSVNGSSAQIAGTKTLDDGLFSDGYNASARMSEPARKFIGQFDNGEYSDLILDPEA